MQQAAFRLEGSSSPRDRAIEVVAKQQFEGPQWLRDRIKGVDATPIGDAEKVVEELVRRGLARCDAQAGLVWLEKSPPDTIWARSQIVMEELRKLRT